MSQLPWLIDTLKFIKEQEDEPLSIEICAQYRAGHWGYHLITAPLEDFAYGYATDYRIDQAQFNALAAESHSLAVIVYYNEQPDWTHPNTASKNMTGEYYQLVLQSDRRSE
jgi:hypothetical protein